MKPVGEVHNKGIQRVAFINTGQGGETMAKNKGKKEKKGNAANNAADMGVSPADKNNTKTY